VRTSRADRVRRGQDKLCEAWLWRRKTQEVRWLLESVFLLASVSGGTLALAQGRVQTHRRASIIIIIIIIIIVIAP
jgi:hypothetical protein